VTLIEYFKELSDKSFKVAVPVSLRDAGAGFSFFADKGILQALTTVGAGVVYVGIYF